MLQFQTVVKHMQQMVVQGGITLSRLLWVCTIILQLQFACCLFTMCV